MFTRYKIIRSFKELKQLVEACLNTGYASVDFETNAEGIYKDTFKPTILSVSFQVGSGCSIPLQHFDESVKEIPWLKWLQYFGRRVVENPNIVKVAQNFKFDNQIFVKYGIYVRGTVIDTMLAKYLLNEEKPHGLKPMVAKYLPEFADYEKYDKFETIPWDKKPLEPLARYGCMDTDFTLRLALFLEKKLIDKGFYNLYRNLIMPASKVLQDAETNGLPIDLSFNDFLQDKYSKLIQETNDKLRSVRQIKRYQKYSLEQRKQVYIDKLTQEIEELSGDPKKVKSIKNREDKISRILAGEYKTNDEKKLIEPVNFNSTKQMVDLLYISPKGFKFPIVEYTKDKRNKPTDNPSTSEDTLIKISDQDKTGFIKSLLDLRGLDKMNSTYIVGLRELVQSDNKVHPTFLIHGCVSGNTKLIGKENDIRIKDICPKEVGVLNIEDKNIWILSHEGTWEQVTHTINKGKQPLYKITTKDGDILRCTKEHKLLTPRGWKRISYIFKHNLNVVMYDTSRLDITKPIVGKRYDEIIFRDIPGWDGYIASSEGKIYSVKIPGGRGMLDYNHPHELVPREWKPGRLRVYLRNNSKKKYAFPVSHLVWMAFNSKLYVPEKMVIDHINCNTLDNRPENLQCITYSENIKRAYKYTRTAFTNNSINGASKFNTLTISKVLEDYQNGHTQAEICERYDISQKQVSGIVNGQRRKDIYLTKLVSMEYMGDKTIYDLSVNDKHSYITRSNFINSNTTSGRLSSRNPNGQNIPKVMVNPDIKKQFIPPSGKLFLTYDYSQAELRILAHLANEETMLEWFRTGKDIHLASACKKYHEDYDKIIKIYEDEQHELYPLWKKRRKQAKTINFGIVYEQSAHKLAESLSTPEEKVEDSEGQQFLDEYFTTFPKIKKFMDKQHKFMEKHGYCVSLFGRRRRCPKVYSDNFSEYLEALRQCVDEETEALTTDGWRRYDQLYNGQLILTKNCNTGILEWQPIENINIYPDYQGDLYSFEGKTFSALTNGKHRWLCNHDSKPGSKAEFLTTEELYNSKIVRPIHRTGEYNGNRKKVLDDDLVYLLGIILTDGHLRYYRDKTKPRYGKPWYALITQSKEKNIPLIQSAIDKLDNRFTYIHKVYGKKHVWKFNKDFADYLDTIIPNKKLNMSLIHSLTKSQIRLLLDGMILGDGCKHGTRILTSSIEQANLIQVLVVMAGYYSNILINDNRGIHISNKIKRGKIITKNISYLVTIGESKYFHHRSTRGINHIKKLSNQKQLIWCPTVKNGTWVCRRKGKTYITGNSTNMPCQSAASDMALFASIIVWEKVRKGELPPMKEVNTVHDSVYQFIEPKYITPDTIYKVWDICRNPSTKKYFGFEIKDVDMSMDFTVGRTMAEELPYIPGYDYNKMLSKDFDIDEYYAEHRKVKNIPIEKYPKKFKSYFDESWRKR